MSDLKSDSRLLDRAARFVGFEKCLEGRIDVWQSFRGIWRDEFRTQVAIEQGGKLEVHDNVVFEANTADVWGGAVSLPYTSSVLTLLLLNVLIGLSRVGLICCGG